jgi:hypothetical protein
MTDINQLMEHLQQPMREFPTLVWKFAKTMATAPHAYVVRSSANEEEFTKLANLIAANGSLEQWKDGRQYRYLDLGPFKYWHMYPVINRARADVHGDKADVHGDNT